MAGEGQSQWQGQSKALDYIARAQKNDGSWLSQSSPQPVAWQSRFRYQTTFMTAQILLALASLPNSPQLATIRTKATAWLFKQKSPAWSFNYWSRSAAENSALPYPDDLDDTFVALAALWQSNQALIGPKALARIVKLLTATEVTIGGPYRTWLVTATAEPIWQDVDLVVNSNIAAFLKLVKVELPQLTKLVTKAIKRQQYASPYYPTIYPALYAISRWYDGQERVGLQKALLDQRRPVGHWGTALDTALAITSLIRLGYPVNQLTPASNWLQSTQKPNGAWPATAFWLDPAIKGHSYYAGSPVLTTVFVLEALALYQKATLQSLPLAKSTRPAPTTDESIRQAINYRVNQRLNQLDPLLQRLAKPYYRKITQNQRLDRLTSLFRQALEPKTKAIPDSVVIDLGVVTVFGWLAYTIYDDFFDAEGQPAALGVANVSLRQLAGLLTEFSQTAPGWHSYWQNILDHLDAANSWESRYCRLAINQGKIELDQTKLPDYQDHRRLAERSFGHALGPIGLLFYLGYGRQSPAVTQLEQFFNHYLIARQLNDDIHDWEIDLRKGRLTPVVTQLLTTFSQSNSQSKNTRAITVGSLISKLRPLFWTEQLFYWSATIHQQLELAHQALASHPLLDSTMIDQALLQSIERSIEQTLKDRQAASQFVDSL